MATDKKTSAESSAGTLDGTELVRISKETSPGVLESRQTTTQEVADLSSSTIINQTINVTGGNELYLHTFGDGVNTPGTDTGATLQALGYDSGDFAAQFPNMDANYPDSIDLSTMTYDLACAQEAMYTLANGTNRKRYLNGGDGVYRLAGGALYLPAYKGSGTSGEEERFIFNGQGVKFRKTGSQPIMISSYVPNQTDAAAKNIFNTWEFGSFNCIGNDTGTAIRMGGHKGNNIHDINIEGFARGFQAGFMLNTAYHQVNVNMCEEGFYIDKGWWTGAGYANAGNQPRFYNCRARTVSNTARGWVVLCADTPTWDGCTVEGTEAEYGIFIDNMDASTSKKATIRDLHVELGEASPGVPGEWAKAIVGYRGKDAHHILISQVYNQNGAGDQVLLEMDSTVGVCTAVLFVNRHGEGSDNWKFRNVNSGGRGCWVFDETMIDGKPASYDKLVNGTSFFTADSVLPENDDVRYTQLLF